MRRIFILCSLVFLFSQLLFAGSIKQTNVLPKSGGTMTGNINSSAGYYAGATAITQSSVTVSGDISADNFKGSTITISQIVTKEIYGARVYLNTEMTNVTEDVWLHIKCNAESYDPQNGYSVTTGSYTVPVSGYYQISGQIEYMQVGDAKRYYCVIYQNFTMIVLKQITTGGTAACSASVSDIAYLNKNDLISLYGRAEPAVGTVDIQALPDRTFLSIMLIAQ